MEKKKRLKDLVHQLVALPHETEWVEFKHNHTTPQEIGVFRLFLIHVPFMAKLGDISFGE